MFRVIEVLAAAKINIGLAIGGRAADGYHPVASVFHAVSVFDRLRLRFSSGEGIEVLGAFDCAPEVTTVYKAAKAFRRRVGSTRGLRIEVEKGIPAKSGLGGGSADAAAALIGLERLFETGLGRSELAKLGATIGADVPFFFGSGAAYVTGRGEVVADLQPRLDIGFLLVEPGFGVSTAEAYAGLDALRMEEATRRDGGEASSWPSFPLRGQAEAERALFAVPSAWAFRNDFGDYLYREHPFYAELERAFRDSGALYVSVTGSGSAMYGVYGSFAQAEAALKVVRSLMGVGSDEKALPGIRLRAIKPLATCVVLR